MTEEIKIGQPVYTQSPSSVVEEQLRINNADLARRLAAAEARATKAEEEARTANVEAKAAALEKVLDKVLTVLVNR